MPSKSPAFSYYPKDLLADTAHLSAEQFGAYWRLASYAWVGIAGCPQGYLPSDPAVLSKLAGVDPRRWRSIAGSVLVLFQERDGVLFHKRLLKELEHQQQKSGAARGSAMLRWQGERSANALPSDSERICEGSAAGAVEAAVEDASKREGRAETFDPPLAAGFAEAFGVWLQTLPAQAAAHAKPTPDRRRKYEARRREGYSHALIIEALSHYVNDPWPQRTTNARARDMETLLRDGGQVETFAAMRPKTNGNSRIPTPEDQLAIHRDIALEALASVEIDQEHRLAAHAAIATAPDVAGVMNAWREHTPPGTPFYAEVAT